MGRTPVRVARRAALGLTLAVVAVLSCTVLGTARRAVAAPPPPPSLYLGGSFEAQQLARTPKAGEFQFIQQRNTLRLLANWTWIDDGEWTGPFPSSWKTGSIENVDVFLLYRGVYDSVYDFLPSVPTTTDYRGEPVPSRFDNLNKLTKGQRDALKYENRLREAYVDVNIDGGWLVRAGRQQIVWGVSDGFRILDRVNSLDLTWHQYQALPPTDDSFDEIRIPFWMLLLRKEGFGIREVDELGAFAEAYWNPGDWTPNKVGYLPTPWGIMRANPLANPETGEQAQLAGGTKLFRQGSYSRNPAENSQGGLRFGNDRHLCDRLTECPLQISIAYLYQRFTPWGGASTSAAYLFDAPSDSVGPGEIALEYRAPYVHTIGLSLSYTPTLKPGIEYPIPRKDLVDYAFRLETTVDLGVPFYSCKEGWQRNPAGPAKCVPVSQPTSLLPPTEKHDIWSGVFGVDGSYRRWNQLLGSFQVFWTYLLDDDETTLGSLDLPSIGEPLETTPAFRDDVRSWEVLTTATLGYSWLGGRVRLSGIHLLDWVNSWSQEAAWALDLRPATGLSVQLSQRFLINPKDEVIFEPWGLAGLNRGRSEIGLRILYEFPTVGF